MFKKKKRYTLKDCSQSVYTRKNVMVKLKPGDVVFKIPDTISDKIAFRSMYRVESTGVDVHIDPMLIKFFEEVE